MKQISAAVLLIILTVLFTSESAAQIRPDAQRSNSPLLEKTVRTYEATSSPQASVPTNQQGRVIQEADRRIQILTDLTTKLKNVRFLSESEKAKIAQNVQEEITILNQIKNKVVTDTTTIRTDVQTLTTMYKTFSFFAAQTRILNTADAVMQAGALLSEFAKKLETRIQAAEAAGNDMTRAKTLLTRMNSEISSAQTLIAQVTATVSSLTPEANNSRTVFQTALRNIRQASQDLRAALEAGNQIREILQETKAETVTPSTTSARSPLGI